jgi:hypothetical protein
MLAVAGIAGFGLIPWWVGAAGDRFGLRVGLGILPIILTVAGVTLAAEGRSK